MRRYKIEHETSYDYKIPVVVSQHLAHLNPRACPRQKWLSHKLEITPEPSAVQERKDLFGNRALSFCIETEHRHFAIKAIGVVDVSKQELPVSSMPWEDAAKAVAHPANDEDWGASFHSFGSPMANFDDAIRRYAEQSFVSGRPLLEAAGELNVRINRDFAYAPATTRIGASPSEVLRERRGVCQDFAHLMCACMRSLGLACRYVSGYLLTHAPEGQQKLVGADATHAWAAAYLPGHGWIEYDPTNRLVVSDEHIALAWGRDFSDVSPLKGVITGGGAHSVKVSVDVKPLERN